MSAPVLIRVYLQNKLVEVKQFTQDQIVVGNNAEVDIDLSHEKISPLHFLIEKRESGYYLTDLGSKEGTVLNGEKILDHSIESSDEITVGPYKFEFFIGVPKPKAAPKGAVSEPRKQNTEEPPPPPPEANEVRLVVSEEPPDAPEDVNVLSDSKVDDVGDPPSLPSSVPVDLIGGDRDSFKQEKIKTEPQDIQVDFSGLKKATYAPPSAIKSLDTVVQPSKGTTLEVLVSWKERVLSTHHFSEGGDITAGYGSGCDIVLPINGLPSKQFKLVSLSGKAVIHAPNSAKGVLYFDGRTKTLDSIRLELGAKTKDLDVTLNQGEMIRLDFIHDNISVFIRYVPESPKPIAAPLFPLTSTEMTGLLFAGVMMVIFGLYMYVYSPGLDEEQKLEEPMRMASIQFKPPTPPPPPKEKRVVKVEDKPKTQQVKRAQPKATQPPGKAAAVAPTRSNQPARKKLVSARPGGSVKTGDKAGSNAESRKRDVTRTGILGVFGSKGVQNKLDQTFSGVGGVAGLADKQTGASGFNEDREGQGIGTRLKSTGSGGKGASLKGISGVSTKRGSGGGNSGTGQGGFGTRDRVNINLGGAEEFFEGTIDREAVRRVIQQNKNAFRFCYEKELKRDSSVYGKVSVKWTIVAGGRVGQVSKVSNTTRSNSLASCIMNRIKGLKFPEPPQDTVAEVIYPFVFQSQ
ncbi:MAG: AgmX/PglI C-terminal domain-containing protein [Bdellovibrionales bacterium]